MKIGSVVRLRGHEIIMTIIAIDSEQELATCMWFDDSKHPQQATFYKDSLDEVFGPTK